MTRNTFCRCFNIKSPSISGRLDYFQCNVLFCRTLSFIGGRVTAVSKNGKGLELIFRQLVNENIIYVRKEKQIGECDMIVGSLMELVLWKFI